MIVAVAAVENIGEAIAGDQVLEIQPRTFSMPVRVSISWNSGGVPEAGSVNVRTPGGEVDREKAEAVR